MKIIYCTHSVCNPGGMERVLANKVTYLVEKLHWDVSIVTTDQKNRPAFYPLPEGVRMTDLGINYSDDNVKHPIGKIFGYLLKRRTHRKRLTELLMREKADIVVFLVAHKEFKTLPYRDDKVILDFCGIYKKN